MNVSVALVVVVLLLLLLVLVLVGTVLCGRRELCDPRAIRVPFWENSTQHAKKPEFFSAKLFATTQRRNAESFFVVSDVGYAISTSCVVSETSSGSIIL